MITESIPFDLYHQNGDKDTIIFNFKLEGSTGIKNITMNLIRYNINYISLDNLFSQNTSVCWDFNTNSIKKTYDYYFFENTVYGFPSCDTMLYNSNKLNLVFYMQHLGIMMFLNVSSIDNFISWDATLV